DAAGHERLVGVALEELDDHFHADARNPHRAPAAMRPELADADPARAVLILLAEAVPVELHFDAAVLVGMDLLAGGADHQGGLRPLHHRLRRHAGRTELLAAGDAGEAAVEIGVVLAADGVFVVARLVGRRRDQVFAVLVVTRKAVQREHGADGETARIADAVHHLIARAQLVEADARQAAADIRIGVGAGIVAHLALVVAMPARAARNAGEVQ